MVRYDVAVVGAGVFGAWVAWHVVERGQRVLLVDAYGPGNARASSAGESRIIRMGYGRMRFIRDGRSGHWGSGRNFSDSRDRVCFMRPEFCGLARREIGVSRTRQQP